MPKYVLGVYCAKYIKSVWFCKPHLYLMKQVQVLQGMKLSTEKLSNLLEVSHIVCGGAGLKSRSSDFRGPHNFCTSCFPTHIAKEA